MRERSNIFACLQDFFLTGAADELLLQPSLRIQDQTIASPGCQMTEEGSFAHTTRTSGILVNEQQEPALLQKEILNALIYCHHGIGRGRCLIFPEAQSWYMSSKTSPQTRTILNCNAKYCNQDWKSAVALDFFMCLQFSQSQLKSHLQLEKAPRLLRQVV